MTPMSYVSTRGSAPELGFADTLLAGLARDGGLYVPARWPSITVGAFERFATASYADVATEVMWPFVEGAIDHDTFGQLVADSYATFNTPDVVPLVDLGDNMWLAELFHGPTLALSLIHI